MLPKGYAVIPTETEKTARAFFFASSSESRCWVKSGQINSSQIIFQACRHLPGCLWVFLKIQVFVTEV